MGSIGSNLPRPAMLSQAGATQAAQGVLADANRRIQSPAGWEQLTAVLTELRPLAGQNGAAFPAEAVPLTWDGDVVALQAAAGQLRPGCCGGAEGEVALKDLVGQLDRLIAALEPDAAGGAPSTGIGGDVLPMSPGNWGSIDTMMAQAEKLAMSEKPSDQLKAQKLMMQARQMFETVSKMLQQMAEMAKTAIGNIR